MCGGELVAKTFFANKTHFPSLVWENTHTFSILSLSLLLFLSLPTPPPSTIKIFVIMLLLFIHSRGGGLERQLTMNPKIWRVISGVILCKNRVTHPRFMHFVYTTLAQGGISDFISGSFSGI